MPSSGALGLPPSLTEPTVRPWTAVVSLLGAPLSSGLSPGPPGHLHSCCWPGAESLVQDRLLFVRYTLGDGFLMLVQEPASLVCLGPVWSGATCWLTDHGYGCSEYLLDTEDTFDTICCFFLPLLLLLVLPSPPLALSSVFSFILPLSSILSDSR